MFYSDSFDEITWDVWLAYSSKQQQVPFLSIITDPGEDGKAGQFEFTQPEHQEVLAAREIARLVQEGEPLPRLLTSPPCQDSLLNSLFWRNAFDMAGQILGMHRGLMGNAMFPDTVVDLRDNKLRLWPTFATIFLGNTTACQLDLTKCPLLFKELDEAGLVEVTDLMYSSALTEVLLGDCALQGDLADMATLPRFERIDLHGNKKVTGRLDAVASMSNMTDFDLSGCTSVGGSLNSLSGWRNLTSLKLHGLGNVQGELRTLKRMTQLAVLDLGRCSGIHGDLSDLSGLVNLTSLDLSRCRKLVGDLRSLDSLTALQSLVLSGSDKFRGTLESLSTLNALKQLELNLCSLIEGDVSALLSMPHLEVAKLHGCRSIHGDLISLTEMQHLVYISVRKCRKIKNDHALFKQQLPDCELFS